ncbi:MAG: hypothetical protein Q8873_00605 [Bacillota bacterium]|nr:hypothetical protein [Bacillota bacterium]
MADAIKALEAKGYIVKAYENRSAGILSETCPIVYEIMRPDYSPVYGANAVSPDNLVNWLFLRDLNAKARSAEAHPTFDAKKDAERMAKERGWDNIYNEGAEGYNPYRGQ